MGNIFYHVSKVPVNIGDHLICGRYGKRIKEMKFDGFHIHKESVFELVRQKIAPHAPSRLNCIFLFDNYNVACAYRFKQHKYRSYIYKVELIRNTKCFAVDHIWLDLKDEEVARIKNCATTEESMKISESIFVERAINYWSQKEATGTLTREVLVVGDVIVKEQILEPFDI